MEIEPFPIRCVHCGQDLGTLNGPVLPALWFLKFLWCANCGDYVEPERFEHARDVGQCTDNYGDKVVVSELDGGVRVEFFRPRGDDSIVMWFDADQRAAFIRLWAEAERRAESDAGRQSTTVLRPDWGREGRDGGES